MRGSSSDELFSTSEMVLLCLEKCKEFGWINDTSRVLEPSSGDGIFWRYFNTECHEITCFDIKPRHEECIEMDFLSFTGNARFDLIIGNPPFGSHNNLAIRFLNKSLELSNRVAFILPLSFLRPSTIDQIRPHNVWIKEFVALPTTKFRIPDTTQTKNIGCGLFFFEHRISQRPLFKELVDIKQEPCSVQTEEDAEYALIRAGGGAGRVVKLGEYSRGTTYLMKGKKDKISSMNWSILSKNGGAGQRSLCLTDIHLAIKMEEMGLDYHSGALGYLKHVERLEN